VPIGARHDRPGLADSLSSDPPDFHRLSLQPGADLFRERGTLAVTQVQETVHSIILALCSHALQSLVEEARLQVLSLGAVQQCQVEMRALQCALTMQPLRPFFQDVVCSCEGRCVAPNVTLLSAARVDELRLGENSC
jgi:hypothetical protein